MISCSGCSPTRSSTTCSTSDARQVLTGPRPALHPLRRPRRSAASRWSSSTRPTRPTRASCRRSSTCTCRWRSSRCSASWPAACTASASCARATALHDLRSYVAIHISLILAVGALITGLDLGQGLVGSLVGLGRADAGLLPDRVPALRLLPAAALLDRGPGAPVALRRGVRDRGRGLRAAELHGRARRRVVHAPARAGHHRRLDAGLDAAHVPRLRSPAWPCCS